MYHSGAEYVDGGKCCIWVGQGIYGTLYFPLSFAVNLKLLLKIKSTEYIFK